MADAEEVKKLNSGNWDAIHVIEVRPNAKTKQASYKLTTTIMLRIATDHTIASNQGSLNLSGSLTRQVDRREMHWR